MIKDYPPYLDYPKPSKPVTNADRVRAMSDEEMARWLTSGVKSVLSRCPGCELSATFEQEALEWLKQEAKT